MFVFFCNIYCKIWWYLHIFNKYLSNTESKYCGEEEVPNPDDLLNISWAKINSQGPMAHKKSEILHSIRQLTDDLSANNLNWYSVSSDILPALILFNFSWCSCFWNNAKCVPPRSSTPLFHQVFGAPYFHVMKFEDRPNFCRFLWSSCIRIY